jgi:hypothetical protein
VVIEGTIVAIKIVIDTASAAVHDERSFQKLPVGPALAQNYNLRVKTELILRRKSDDKVVWKGVFDGETVYSAPHIGTPVVNSADATYNQSVRTHALTVLAETMMNGAHDRMTENF